MQTGQRKGIRGLWPVVQRELRESARRPFNHWLRVLSAAAGMGLFWIMLSFLAVGLPEAAVGARLFASLHALLLTLICCIAPTMTADCIAREKREGTLPLLFLTGLTPAGIVIGKSLVQGFRTFILWVAVLPVLTIPFLTGGVGWPELVNAVTVELCVAILCLAAGLLASTLVKTRAVAFGLALGFAAGLLVLFSLATPLSLSPWAALASRFGYGSPGVFTYRGSSIYNGGAYYYMSGQFPSVPIYASRPRRGAMVTRLPFGLKSGALARPVIQAGSVGVALLVFLLVVKIAARRVESSWKDKPPSTTRVRLLRTYCSPLFKGWLAGRMHRALDRNPIVWLQQFSWKARVTKWGLCLVFVYLDCVMISNVNLGDIVGTQCILVGVLAVVFTFVGVNSFLDEKRNGALELILVTPLSVNQIIWGRVWGLWKQFLPAALIIGGFYFAASRAESRLYYWEYYEPGFNAPLWFTVFGYLSLPVFATYFALRARNLIIGAVLTWVALILAPLMGYGALDQLCWRLGINYSTTTGCMGALAGDVAFVFLVCFLLRHSLSRRIYSF